MSLSGSLMTMPLPDVLQWLASAGKTGTFRVERSRVAKWISFRKGRVVGCSTDAPPQRLGQYLLARGRITDAELREALAAQERDGEPLGTILVAMGCVERADLAGHLESQAEETIYSLFDWHDGVFRYEDGLEEQDGIPFPLDMRVEDILLRGLKRFDEMTRIRQIFQDPGIVLRYTEIPPGPEIFGNAMARAMYSTIDGDRTIADILLQVHGSEYIVYKFLFELHRNGYVEIAEVRPIASGTAEANDAEPNPPNSIGPRPSDGGDTAVAVEPAKTAVGIDAELELARAAMADGEYDVALDTLDRLYREQPDDDALRRLTAEAEAAFVDRAYELYVPAQKVPVLTRPVAELAAEAMSPHDFFLLSRIDGSWDVRSIIQVSPLREVDALRTLKRMREQGVIKLHDP